MSIHFNIADFLIRIEGIDAYCLKHPLLDLFRVQKDSKSPDLIIRFKRSDIFNRNFFGNLLFENEGQWIIYKWRKSLFFYDSFNFLRYGCKRIISRTEGSFKWDFYLEGCQGFFGFKNPFLYPLGQLLLLDQLGRTFGVSVHAAGIETRREEGFIFCGASGCGKTTISRLWVRHQAGDSLHDDRIIIRKIGEQILIYGCPWSTREPDLVSNVKVTLEKIFFIQPTEEKNGLRRLSSKESFLRLLQNAYYPFWDKEAIDTSLKLLDHISKKVECWELKFVPSSQLIDLIEKMM